MYETTEDMEAGVDKLQALDEEQLARLKDDITSSETSNPRTPSLDIELGDLSESEEAASENHTPELLDEVFRFRDPEPVRLDEMDKAGEAVQEHLGQEHLGQEHLTRSFKFRDPEQLNNGSIF